MPFICVPKLWGGQDRGGSWADIHNPMQENLNGSGSIFALPIETILLPPQYNLLYNRDSMRCDPYSCPAKFRSYRYATMVCNLANCFNVCDYWTLVEASNDYKEYRDLIARYTIEGLLQ